jgi:hypothetical protein
MKGCGSMRQAGSLALSRGPEFYLYLGHKNINHTGIHRARTHEVP